jgi:hypothetical protein
MSEVQERVAANVVTSDNLAEFTARKMGLVDSKPAEPAAAEPDAQADAEPDTEGGQSGPDGEGNEATTEGEQKERKPNPKIERRFSEITKQREAAREEARKEREAREALEARLKELEAKANPKAAQAEPDAIGPEPKPEEFNDMFEYAKALAEYTADKKLMERDKAESERKAQEARAQFEQNWAQKVDKARQELPDFDDMIQSSDVAVSDPVRDAIMESDVGPKILYYLAENPEFAQELGKKSVISALREIGKLEARFEKAPDRAPAASEPESKSTVAKSKAPAPITPIRGAVSTVENNVDSDGNFHGTYQQWKAARQARKIR